jgi:hypothetical protein
VAPRLRDWIVTNWPIKLTALVLAGILWAVVAAEEPTTQLVPVELAVELPEGRTLTRALPQVQALYAGSARELIKVYASPPTVRKAVPDTVSGSEYTLALSIADLSGAENANVKAQDIQPRTIVLHLDDVSQRRVRVVPRVSVTPDSGFAGFGLALMPSSVTVRGPEALVRGIDSVVTLPLELSGVTGPVDQAVGIDTAGLGLVRVSPDEVDIAVDVGPVSERVLMGVPVLVPRDRAGRWESIPPAVIVTVRGRSGRLARLTRDSVEAVALVEGDDPEQVVRLDVIAPAGVGAAATPDTVRVRRRGRG